MSAMSDVSTSKKGKKRTIGDLSKADTPSTLSPLLPGLVTSNMASSYLLASVFTFGDDYELFKIDELDVIDQLELRSIKKQMLMDAEQDKRKEGADEDVSDFSDHVMDDGVYYHSDDGYTTGSSNSQYHQDDSDETWMSILSEMTNTAPILDFNSATVAATSTKQQAVLTSRVFM